jgi:hypothetical protein
MATIKQNPEQACTRQHITPNYRATKPDRCFFYSGEQTIKPGHQAHKPADSGVPVGNDARRCSFHEVTLTANKRQRLYTRLDCPFGV